MKMKALGFDLGEPTQGMTRAIFDLDGTLCDPAEGIVKSLNHALVALGHCARPGPELLRYIGPPLRAVFADLLSTTEKGVLSSGIALYRERYGRVGYSESRLYEGIEEALADLRGRGCRLYVATSKRQDFAEQVLGHLGIRAFFCQVLGCDLDRSKADVLRGITASAAGAAWVVVGDRESDFLAADEVGIPSIGVRWGYGSDGELARASLIVSCPNRLPEAIENAAQPLLRRGRAEPPGM